MESWALIKSICPAFCGMAYALYWTEEHIEAARRDYSRDVADRLRDVLASKDRQLLAVENPAGLGKRFHNTFTLNGLKVAEISFNVHGREFRAVCIVLHDLEAVWYHTLVDKNDQERALRTMREKSDTIEAAIRDQISSGPS